MSYSFYHCESLLTLPDISTWNTDNLFYCNNLFSKCLSLAFLPKVDIWNTPSILDANNMFTENINCVKIPNNFEIPLII